MTFRKSAKSPNSKIAYATGIKLFIDFQHKDPTQILNEYRNDIQENQYKAFEKWEQIFDDFALHLETEGYKGGSVSLYHSAAKALINANVPRSLRLQAKTPEVYSKTIKGVTIDELRKIWDMCNTRERAFIAVLKDSGISAADVVRLNWGNLEGYYKGEQWIRIYTLREKEHVEYETFLGPNAVEVLRAYETLRKNKGENLTADSPIFTSTWEPFQRLTAEDLGRIFVGIEKKTGVEVSTHRLRKFFETYMALTVRHPIILKYWMGHKIRKGQDVEARYIIPPTPEQLELYKEAYKTIDLIAKPEADELLKAEIKTRLEGLNANQRKAFIAEITTMYGERVRRILKQVHVSKSDVKPDGAGLEDCDFEQINESQLLSYLKAGWQIVKELQNGEVIVKR